MKYRIHPQSDFNFDEIVVDSFAGGGGASTGIEAALGRPIDIAINHSEKAILMHTINHPRTKHYCEDVFAIDPVEACEGRPVGLAWFSPDCTHHSKARGGKPVKKNIRGLAWIVLKWASKVQPKIIMLENVEEFQGWGPLTSNNKPCKKRKGQTFQQWKAHLKNLGYQVEHRELRACDYGAPTIRKRLFIIARCDGEAIVWPEPTHGPGLLPYKTAADIIDWSIPCPSIFERKRPLVENTLRRIAKGIQKFVIDNPEPFIVPLTHHGERHNHNINEPMKTVTGANRGELALITPYLTEHANGSSQRVMPIEKPLRTQCAQVKGGHFAIVAPLLELMHTKSSGRSVEEPLVTSATKSKAAVVTAFLAQHNLGAIGRKGDAPLSTIMSRGTQQQIVVTHMIRHFGESVGSGVRRPVGTITSGGMGKTGIVTSNLVKLRGTCQHGQKVDEPMPTVTGGGLHVGEVRAFLLKYYGTAIGQDCNDVMHTVTSKERFGLVTIKGEEYQIVDIGMRMLSPRELFRAQGFKDNYIIDRTADGKPITKTDQVRMCGNSVCPPIAEALVRSNYKIIKSDNLKFDKAKGE